MTARITTGCGSGRQSHVVTVRATRLLDTHKPNRRRQGSKRGEARERRASEQREVSGGGLQVVSLPVPLRRGQFVLQYGSICLHANFARRACIYT